MYRVLLMLQLKHVLCGNMASLEDVTESRLCKWQLHSRHASESHSAHDKVLNDTWSFPCAWGSNTATTMPSFWRNFDSTMTPQRQFVAICDSKTAPKLRLTGPLYGESIDDRRFLAIQKSFPCDGVMLTHWDRVVHICVSKLGHHRFR